MSRVVEGAVVVSFIKIVLRRQYISSAISTTIADCAQTRINPRRFLGQTK